MRLAIFADDRRYERLRELCESPGVAEKVEETAFYVTYDDFIRELPQSSCNAIIIAYKGATGMQAVRAAKILMFRIPIIWLSDDSGFLDEAYRIGCAYFSPDTINEKTLLTALGRCEAKGEN